MSTQGQTATYSQQLSPPFFVVFCCSARVSHTAGASSELLSSFSAKILGESEVFVSQVFAIGQADRN